MDHETNLNSAAEWWAKQTDVCQTTRQHWESHPIVQATMTARRGAATSAAWLERRLPRAPLRALSLGAGAGLFELDLVSRGAVASYDLVDITPQLMEGAAARAAEQGFAGRIRCYTADINRIEIEPDAYDLITFVGALHHVERLEHVLDACREGLRPGGLFFISEYVGPNRFAFPPAHADLANEIYCSIDPRLRTQPVMPRPNPRDVAAADPTEAIRSEEILDLVSRFFRYGGDVLGRRVSHGHDVVRAESRRGARNARGPRVRPLAARGRSRPGEIREAANVPGGHAGAPAARITAAFPAVTRAAIIATTRTPTCGTWFPACPTG